jgi:hypothetical protein
VVAILSRHPITDAGSLVICDPARGPNPMDAIRTCGPTDGLYRHPWPMPDGSVVAAWSATGTSPWIMVRIQDGRREPLWPDGDAACAVPVHLPATLARPSLVDWRLTHGWIYIQDLHAAGRLAQTPLGTATTLRISTLRADRQTDGSTRWLKTPLGTAPVAADGSIFAQVPARIPLAFDVLDRQGQVLAEMGRWTTVQRGERVSCLGCHAPPTQVPRRGGALAFNLPPAEVRLPGHLLLDAPEQMAWLRGEQQRIQDLVLALFGNN